MNRLAAQTYPGKDLPPKRSPCHIPQKCDRLLHPPASRHQARLLAWSRLLVEDGEDVAVRKDARGGIAQVAAMAGRERDFVGGVPRGATVI